MTTMEEFCTRTRADAIVSAIPEQTQVLADIGYDLGRIALLALQRRPNLRVIGVEIQPDAGARTLARMASEGVSRTIRARFEPRTGDGLTPLRPGEVDTVLMAGIGEPTMLRALAERAEITAGLTSMVLCTPTLESMLRPAFALMGRSVGTAAIAFERGRFYEVLVVGAPGSGEASADPVEAAWGRNLFTTIDPPLARAFVDDTAWRFRSALASGLRAYARDTDRFQLGVKLGLLEEVRRRLGG